jgi:hypothetical protein
MTDLSPTNWRALCAELHAVFNTYAVCQEHHQLLVHTAAALAQPEPLGPTDEELLFAYDEFDLADSGDTDVLVRGLRAVLARWGNQ